MRRDLLTKPKSWAHTSLKEVCYILDYRRVPVNTGERTRRIAGRLSDDLYPYYGATGQVGVIDDFIFEGEHILLGEDGAPFLDPLKDKAYLVQGRFWVNNHAHILKSMISNKYVCHYLNVIDYSEHVTGTTRLKLTQSALRSIPISIPSMAEQRRIVTKIEELFSELDKGIESLKKAHAQLATYRQAVLKHAFEGQLTAQWRRSEQGPDRDVRPVTRPHQARTGGSLRTAASGVGCRSQDLGEKRQVRAEAIEAELCSKATEPISPCRVEQSTASSVPSWQYVRLSEYCPYPVRECQLASRASSLTLSRFRILSVANVQRGHSTSQA